MGRPITSAPVYARDFIGRSTEMAFLRERVQAAIDGEGSLTLLSGEAGAGKTRLLAELRSACSDLTAMSVVGQCLEFARSPYGPFSSLLDSMVAIFEPAAPPAPHLRTALRLLVPSLYLPTSESTGNEDLQRRWMFEAVRETFGRFSAKHPALLLLEDIHWADAGSLDLLRFLSPALIDLRICVIASYRSDAIDRQHPLHALLAEVDRGRSTFRVELPTLDDDAALALIDSAVPESGRLPAETRRQVCALGEGNPLFLEELVKSALQTLDVPAALPRSLDHAVQAHLAALPDDQVNLIETAAVIGRRFDARDLQRLSGAPASLVAAGLRSARDANILSADPREFESFQFRHELTRQIIAQHALPGLVRDVQRRIATELDGSREAATRAAELAYRWREAGEPQKAATYAEIAGDRAVETHAFADAAALYESALAQPGTDPAAPARMHKKAGHYCYLISELERADSHFRAAAKYYEESGNDRMLAEVCLDLAAVALRRSSLGDAVALSRRAVTLAEPLFPGDQILVRVLLNLAEYTAFSGDANEAAVSLDAVDRLSASLTPNESVGYYNDRAIVAFL